MLEEVVVLLLLLLFDDDEGINEEEDGVCLQDEVEGLLLAHIRRP